MKQLIPLILLVILYSTAQAQKNQTIYLDGKYAKTKKRNAKFYQEIKWDDKTRTACKVKLYRIDDLLLKRSSYANYPKKIYRDTVIKYGLNGKVEYLCTYGKNNKKKKYIDCHFDGRVHTVRAYYEDGVTYQVVKYKLWDEKKQTQEKEVFGIAERSGDTLREKLYDYKERKLKKETIYSIKSNDNLEKKELAYYYDSGELFYREFYSKKANSSVKIDSIHSYYESGELKRKEYFSKNLKNKNRCFAKDGSKIKFTPLFENANFPNGESAMLNWLGRNISYPREASERGISGTVYASFTVCKDGELCEFKIVEGLHKSMDNEVLRALKKMPKWTPGKKEGKAVRSHFTLPVQFRQ